MENTIVKSERRDWLRKLAASPVQTQAGTTVTDARPLFLCSGADGFARLTAQAGSAFGVDLLPDARALLDDAAGLRDNGNRQVRPLVLVPDGTDENRDALQAAANDLTAAGFRAVAMDAAPDMGAADFACDVLRAYLTVTDGVPGAVFPTDYSGDVDAWADALTGTAAEWRVRALGVSMETIRRLRVGYAESWRHPAALPDVPAVDVLIFPAGPCSYTAYDVERNTWYSVGPAAPFGLSDAFSGTGDDPVFVTYSETDALRLWDVGERAVCVRQGTGNLIQRARKTRRALILSDDIPDVVRADVADSGVFSITVDLCGDIDAARRDGAGDPMQTAFMVAVDRAKTQARAQVTADDVERAESLFSVHYMDAFDEYAAKIAATPPIETGFPLLDKWLGCGLYPGLFALGGGTGGGKTAFALQIADHIAERGRSVLYIALEMSRYELFARSFARITADKSEGGQPGAGVPYRDILNGASDDLIARAKAHYRARIAPNIAIVEAIGDVGAAEIRATAQAVTAARGQAPVVIVDYLQAMKPADFHMSERQAVDANVFAMKRLSRDLDTPVIVLSSLNRESMKDGDNIGLYSFKESGCIEYTADVALMLREIASYPRWKIGLQIFKNRRNRVQRGKCIDFEFVGETCTFIQGGACESPERATWSRRRASGEDAGENPFKDAAAKATPRKRVGYKTKS